MRKILLAAAAAFAFIAPAKAQQPAFSTTISGTISTTNVYQVIVSRPGIGEVRHSCVIQNLGANNMSVSFGSVAVTTPNSIRLTPSSTVRCDSGGVILQDQIAITGTAGDQWIAVIQ